MVDDPAQGLLVDRRVHEGVVSGQVLVELCAAQGGLLVQRIAFLHPSGTSMSGPGTTFSRRMVTGEPRSSSPRSKAMMASPILEKERPSPGRPLRSEVRWNRPMIMS